MRDLSVKIAESKAFKRSILTCIILNAVCLSITWYGEPEELVLAMEIINIFFTVVYTVEMIIKLVAFKREYFTDGWNGFDFLIVIIAWIGLISFFLLKIKFILLTTTVRAFRILRVLKLIHRARNLHKILNTFLLAIPELANTGALLFLFLLLFSVMGVYLFSGVRLQESLDEHANFQDVGTAMLTLFRMSTGEDWQEIMHDCARQEGILFQCVEDQRYEEQR